MLLGAWGLLISSPGKGVLKKGSSLHTRMDHAYVHILTLLVAVRSLAEKMQAEEVEVSGSVLV